jgi:hypothetical protein
MTAAGERRVVIHADDLGMSHGANRAFAELWRLGVCSSGSVMPPCPWFAETCEMAITTPSLDIGVHLTLTSEMRRYKWRPMTAPPTSAGLTDDCGYFHASPALVRAYASREAVETELRAQVDAALACGIDVTHLDDHAGTVLMPEFCDIYIRIGRDYRLPILITRELSTYGGLHNMAGVRAEDYARHAEFAAASGFQLFDQIIETPWHEGEPAAETYRQMIGTIGPGHSFLALHPTCPGEIDAIDVDLHHIRTAEYGILKSDSFRRWFAGQELEVIGMRKLRDELRARLAADELGLGRGN